MTKPSDTLRGIGIADIRQIGVAAIRRHGFSIASVPVPRTQNVIYSADKNGKNHLVKIQARRFPVAESLQSKIDPGELEKLQKKCDSHGGANACYAYIAYEEKNTLFRWCMFDIDSIGSICDFSSDSGKYLLRNEELQKRARACDSALYNEWDASEAVLLPATHDVAELNEFARQLLALLVGWLAPSGEPQKYLGYLDCLSVLGLDAGEDNPAFVLADNGMLELSQWLKDNRLPALTGLIINKKTKMPGEGYFSLYDMLEEGIVTKAGERWWKAQIATAQAFDWSPFVGAAPEQPQEPALVASDIAEPPGSEEVTVSRIIRDSALTRQVKESSDYCCRLCGTTIELPNGQKYAEAHHLQPLGDPHSGPDIGRNMICVCPNCHARLDFGAVELDADAIAKTTGNVIGGKYIEYHNEIYKAKINKP